jgi:hypothetical protein
VYGALACWCPGWVRLRVCVCVYLCVFVWARWVYVHPASQPDIQTDKQTDGGKGERSAKVRTSITPVTSSSGTQPT